MTGSRRRSRGVLEGSAPGSAAAQGPPRWSRNDPERPIGYDPERWAGLDSEGQADPDPGQRADLDPESAPDPSVEWRATRAAERQATRTAQRAARTAERRAARPKQRPERSPQERVERAAQRQGRAQEAVDANPAAAAREIVLRQLTMGARTRAQLEQAIARKNIPEHVATAVLDRFEAVDLVDDKEFSRQWVQSRHLGRGLARRALAHELRQRGVAEETLKDAVDAISSDDELTAARDLVRRKAATMRNDDPQRRIRRLAGMLARKGYGGGVAMQAIREELAEFDLPDPEDLDSLANGEDG
jgi:regulatory protein